MKNKYLVWIIVAAVIVTLLIVIGKVIGIKNRLVELDENTKKGWAQVESQLQRRLDLVPNLVETVKGYAKQEEKVLTEVTKARASVAGAQTTPEKIQANNQLSSALSRLLVVVERYPDLKSNQNFLALQDELAGTENRISVARQRYNEDAQLYNSTRRKIPYSFFAGGFPEAPYFKADEGATETPKVSF
ncbi:MAG: LemA family protein [Chitinispirillaceae bacterium]|nr:LemA family protein [Chitinispirillaceae bacterium]